MSFPVVEISDHSGGLNNGVNQLQIEQNQTPDSENVQLVNATVKKRPGSVKINKTAKDQPSLRFNFSRDGWVYIPDASGLESNLTKLFSLEFWVEPTQLGNNIRYTLFYWASNGVTALGAGDNIAVYLIDKDATAGIDYELRIEYVTSGGTVVSESTDLNLSSLPVTPFHAAFIRSGDGSTNTWYKDGVALAMNTTGAVTNDLTITTGLPVLLGSASEVAEGRVNALDPANHRLFQGRLQEVRLWNVARTSGNLTTFKDKALRAADISSDLVAYWRLNDGTGTVVANSPLSLAGSGANGRLEPSRPTFVDGIIPSFVQQQFPPILSINSASDRDPRRQQRRARIPEATSKALLFNGYQQFAELEIEGVNGDEQPGRRLFDLFFAHSNDNNGRGNSAAPHGNYYDWLANPTGTTLWTIEFAFEFVAQTGGVDPLFYWQVRDNRSSGDSTEAAGAGGSDSPIILYVYSNATNGIELQFSAQDNGAAVPQKPDNLLHTTIAGDWTAAAVPTLVNGTRYFFTVARLANNFYWMLRNLDNEDQSFASTLTGAYAFAAVGGRPRIFGPGDELDWARAGRIGLCENAILAGNNNDPSDSTARYSNVKMSEIRIWGRPRMTGVTESLSREAWENNTHVLDLPADRTRWNTLIPTGAVPPNDNQSIRGLIGYWPVVEDWREYDDNLKQGITDFSETKIEIPWQNFTAAITTGDGTQVSGAPWSLKPQTSRPRWTAGMMDGPDKGPGIDGLFNFIQTDESQALMIASGCRISKALAAALPLDTTDVQDTHASAGKLISFAKHENELFGGNGVDLNFNLRPNLTEAEIMGIIPPEMPPQVYAEITGASAVDDQGDISYRYTYVSHALNLESAPSPASAIVRRRTDSQIVVKMSRPRQRTIDASRTVTVDAIRIYRTFHGLASGALFATGTGSQHFVKEIPIGAETAQFIIWNDDTDDDDMGLALAEIDGYFLNGFPPLGKYLVLHQSRIFIAGNPDKPNRLFWSEPDSPYYFAENSYIDIEGSEGQTITGLVSFIGRLYIFTPSSTWILFGADFFSFDLIELNGRFGCPGHHSIIKTESLLYLITQRGPHIFDGRNFRYIGEPIEADWDRVEHSRLDEAQGAYFEQEGLWLLSLPLKTPGYTGDHNARGNTIETHRTGNNELVLVYDTEERVWEPRFSGFFANVMLDTHDNEGLARVFVGDSFGFVYRILRSDCVCDGARNFTTETKGTATSGSANAVGDSAASWPTAVGDNLKGLLVEVTKASDGTVSTSRIVQNTATELRVSPDLSFSVSSGDTYRIARIDAYYRTAIRSFAGITSEVLHRYVEIVYTAASNGTLDVRDWVEFGATATLDQVTLDTTLFRRIEKSRRARTIQLEFRNKEPDETFEILRYTHRGAVRADRQRTGAPTPS